VVVVVVGGSVVVVVGGSVVVVVGGSVVVVVGGSVVVVVGGSVVVVVVGGGGRVVVVVVVGGSVVVVVVGGSVVVVVGGGSVVVVVVGNGSGSGNSWIGVPADVVVVVLLTEGLVETLGWVDDFDGLVAEELLAEELVAEELVRVVTDVVVDELGGLVKMTVFGITVVGVAPSAAVVGVVDCEECFFAGCVTTVVAGAARFG
jgi:hypothetical protein